MGGSHESRAAAGSGWHGIGSRSGRRRRRNLRLGGVGASLERQVDRDRRGAGDREHPRQLHGEVGELAGPVAVRVVVTGHEREAVLPAQLHVERTRAARTRDGQPFWEGHSTKFSAIAEACQAILPVNNPASARSCEKAGSHDRERWYIKSRWWMATFRQSDVAQKILTSFLSRFESSRTGVSEANPRSNVVDAPRMESCARGGPVSSSYGGHR